MSTASTVSSRFAVQGMTCGHCEGRVIKSLCAIAGVQSVTASAKDAAAEVAHDGRVSRKTLADAIVAAGYEVSDAVPDDGIRPGTAQVVVPESQVELNAAADGAMADPIAGAHVETIWHSGRLSVGGMHCASCVSAIDQVIAAMEGVDAVSVDLILHAAHVRFDSTKTDLGKIAAQVSALGYPAVPAQADDDPLSTEEVKETSWVAIAFALAMGVLTMVLSMPLMDDHHDPLAHTFMVLDQWLAAVWPSLYHWPPALLRWTSALAALLVLLGPARPILQRAWASTRRWSPDMNVLVALGTGVAFCFSLVVMIIPDLFTKQGVAPHIWFDAVPWVLGLVLLGQRLEGRARQQTTAALRQIAKLQPTIAHLLRNDLVSDVPVRDLVPGDHLLIRAGERLPVDGLVRQGQSQVDESLLTGEPLGVDKAPGARVHGGSLNGEGALTIEVTATGPQSAAARIGQLVVQAQAIRPDVQRLADRVAAVFVPTVLVLSVLTAVVWLLVAGTSSWIHAVTAAMSVLIIACPCAMGLAVPAAVMVATGRAAQMGILLRSGKALETAARITVVVLDKTGTVTAGAPTLGPVELYSDGISLDMALAWAAALQQGASHPLARAVEQGAKARQLLIPKVENLQTVPGKGVQGWVQGRNVRLGRATWLQEAGIELPVPEETALFTQSWLAVDQQLWAQLRFSDAVQPTAAAAIAELKRMGLKTLLLSGDKSTVVRQVQGQLGIDAAIGEALPEEKVQQIKKLRDQGEVVAMVGDGVNDAPALAAADLGIAMGHGTDVAMAAADLTITSNDLGSIAAALRLSRATVRNMRQNLGWALAYNALGIPVAAGVLYPWTGTLISPVWASAAMALSSLCVVGNALRLGRVKL